jgi:hypothetical protein
MRLDYLTAAELEVHCRKLITRVFKTGQHLPPPTDQSTETFEHLVRLYGMDPDYAIFSARLQATLQPKTMGDMVDRLLNHFQGD